MGKKKRNLNQKGVDKVQEQDKKEETTETVEDNNSSTEQKQVDNKGNTQEPVTEEKEASKKDKPVKAKSNLTLIKGKVAEKGLKSFLRCGIKFTNEYQELEVDKQQLARLKLEPKLTIQVIK